MNRRRPAIESYLCLSASEVLVDLPGLDVDQLQLVRSFEESGPQRVEVLARIGELLDGRDATGHPDSPPAAPVPGPVEASIDIRPRRRRPPPVRRWLRPVVPVMIVAFVVQSAAVRLGRDLATPASFNVTRPAGTQFAPARPAAATGAAAASRPVGEPTRR